MEHLFQIKPKAYGVLAGTGNSFVLCLQLMEYQKRMVFLLPLASWILVIAFDGLEIAYDILELVSLIVCNMLDFLEIAFAILEIASVF